MEEKTTLKTVQEEWMGSTKENGQEQQEVVVRECSCSFD